MSTVVCPQCGAHNRLDERARSMQPVCGRCGARLLAPQPSAPVELTDSSFQQFLQQQSGRPVLVDCWAAWCGPCRMLAPVIEQLAAEGNGRWAVAKLDVDQNSRTAAHYTIESIPTMLLFRDGQLMDRIVGVHPKAAIVARLEAATKRRG